MRLASTVEPATAIRNDLVFSLGRKAEEFFREKKADRPEPLQNELDALSAQVAGQACEPFRERIEEVLRVLRDSYGELARFADLDFRSVPAFFLGQVHALSEVADRLAHQRVPKRAMELVLKSRVSQEIITKVMEARSIGGAELAEALGMEESNLSAACRPLVEGELLRKDRYGNRVRYSPTPLTFAIVNQLREKAEESSGAKTEAPKARALAATAAAGGAPDWSILSLEAAAASFAPGENVTATVDDYISGLLTLAGVQGGSGVAIHPAEGKVEIIGHRKENQTVMALPKSVNESLAEQVRAIREKKVNEADWRGQILTFHTEGERGGKTLEIRFAGAMDKRVACRNAKVVFRETQNEKARAVDYEKFFVTEVLRSVEGKKGKAAEILGTVPKQVGTIVKNLQVEV